MHKSEDLKIKKLKIILKGQNYLEKNLKVMEFQDKIPKYQSLKDLKFQKIQSLIEWFVSQNLEIFKFQDSNFQNTEVLNFQSSRFPKILQLFTKLLTNRKSKRTPKIQTFKRLIIQVNP